MKKKLHYLFYFLLASLSTNAQTIYLEFPYFAGQTYEFTIFQGDKRIKLTEDTIPKGGKVQLTIPENYKGYKGMAQWYLTNSANGGGLDFIINNEDFSVVCLDSIPTAESIVYKNTAENRYGKDNFKKQQQLFEKHDAMLATQRAYDPKSKFYKRATIEYEAIKKQYEAYSNSLLQSPLYAAKFRQIVNLTMGIGTLITLDEKEKAININDFMTNTLDYEALYTSNHWGGIINNWVQVQAMVLKDDAKMVADATTILNRIKTDVVYTDFVINLTKELTKVGKDDVLFAMAAVIKNSKRLLNYDGILTIFKLDLTVQAPDLVILNTTGNTASSSIIKTTELNSKYSLLIFHQSGCEPCEALMQQLPQKYKMLTDKEIRVISISSDESEEVFKNASKDYPWADKYCDFKGKESVNFKNYAVLGTPTMYLLDSKGIIIKKFATAQDLFAYIKN